MRKRRKKVLVFLSVLLISGIWFPKGIAVNAKETIEPAGYHKDVTTEDESIDHWYGVGRGNYLKEGISGIKDAGNGKVSVSGTTTAYSICDTIKVGIYLDESSDGGSSFEQIGSYYFSRENASTCHGNKTDISVRSGRYYMARGGHSATKGSTTEMTTTKTRAIKCS